MTQDLATYPINNDLAKLVNELLFKGKGWQKLVEQVKDSGEKIRRYENLDSLVFPSFKLIESVIVWVHYTIPFGFSLFWHFLVITFQHFILHVWLRITDEGSVPAHKCAYAPYR